GTGTGGRVASRRSAYGRGRAPRRSCGSRSVACLSDVGARIRARCAGETASGGGSGSSAGARREIAVHTFRWGSDVNAGDLEAGPRRQTDASDFIAGGERILVWICEQAECLAVAGRRGYFVADAGHS